jgi:hypothetical protein
VSLILSLCGGDLLTSDSYVHGFMDGQAMGGGYFEPVIVELV